jgi:hypothetical protein
MTTTTSPSGLGLVAIGSSKAPGLAFGVGAEPFSLDGAPSMATEVPSSGDFLSEHTGTSTSS